MKQRGFQAVILAGGKGTRLMPLTRNTPKAMISIRGKPFLEYEVRLLVQNGISDIILCVGYLGNVVMDYFGDGDKFGTRIRYSSDGQELKGPIGALKGAESLLDEHFFVTYGDAYLRADYFRIMDTLLESQVLGAMTVYHNCNKYGPSDIELRDGHVVRYDKVERGKKMEWVNFGITALTRKALALIPNAKEFGEAEFYGEMIRRHELIAVPVNRRFYEIGSMGSLREFEHFISRQSLV